MKWRKKNRNTEDPGKGKMEEADKKEGDRGIEE